MKSIKQFIGTWLSLGKRDDGVSLVVDFSLWISLLSREGKLILAFDRLGSTRSIGVGRIQRASDTF